MKADTTTVENEFQLNAYIDLVKKNFKEHGAITYSYKKGRRRSGVQNNSLQLYCQRMADALNDAGFDMKYIMKDDADIPWSKDSVREHLWMGIQKAVTGQSSTTEPSTTEYVNIYDILNRHMINKHGIAVEWPSNPAHEMLKRKQ